MAAAYLRSIPMLARTIIETSDIETVKKQLNVRAFGYWDRHFQFGKMSVFKIKRMGAVAQRTIVVNAVIPFVYMYGKLIGESSYTDKAVHWLECEKPEKFRRFRLGKKRNRIENRIGYSSSDGIVQGLLYCRQLCGLQDNSRNFKQFVIKFTARRLP